MATSHKTRNNFLLLFKQFVLRLINYKPHKILQLLCIILTIAYQY